MSNSPLPAPADILLLHGLGVKLCIVCGASTQVPLCVWGDCQHLTSTQHWSMTASRPDLVSPAPHDTTAHPPALLHPALHADHQLPSSAGAGASDSGCLPGD